MGRRSDIDWEAVERDYRLGLKTDQQVADAHGISRSALLRKAKKPGEEWTKDLSAQVKLQTKARISEAIVKKATDTLQESDTRNATAVEVEAISNALMVANHETLGTKGRELFEKIIDRIAEHVDATPSIEVVAKMVEADDPQALPALRKVLCLPSYVDSAKKATEGAAKAIEIERKARNLDDAEPTDNDPITVIERRIIG